jgi:hypothetical protein
MAIGYFPATTDADVYFATKRLESAAWDALSVTSTKDEKTACLYQAFQRIYYSQEFILPKYTEATAEELETLQQAQAEMAYYLAEHLPDEDTRRGLQIQGVVGANAVGETYDKAMVEKTPIPTIVRDLLQGWWAGTDVPIHVTDIDRDEDYSVDEDVTELL